VKLVRHIIRAVRAPDEYRCRGGALAWFDD